MRNVSLTPAVSGYVQGLSGQVTHVRMNQMTMTLFGLFIYLFCVHSFKLPLASLGIAIGVLGVLARPNEITIPPPVMWFGTWLLWCAVTAIMSPFRSAVDDSLIEYLKLFLIFFVATNAARTMSQLVILIGTWVLLFGLYPVRGTFFNFLSGNGTFGRYGWNFTFANYNDLASYAILVLAMSVFLLAGRYNRWIRIAAFLGAGSLSLLIIITQSRGAFVGLALGFLLMLLRSRNRARIIRFGALASLAVVLVAPGDVWERFSRMKYLSSTETIAEADGSAAQRYTLLQVGYAIAKSNLVTGVGLGAYPIAHGIYSEERDEWRGGRGNRDTHNLYLNLVAETGIPGALLFIGILTSTLLFAANVEGQLRITMLVEAEQLRILRFGLIAYLIAAIFGTFHRVSFLYLYLAVLWSATTIFASMLTSFRTRDGQGAIVSPVGRPLRGMTPGRSRASRAYRSDMSRL
jgi:O-antigen ligase